MASKPRIITVDPTEAISRVVRSAMDIFDFSHVQIDVPSADDALEELSDRCNLVVTAFDLHGDIKGFELAMRIKQSSPDTAVIVLGDIDDPDEFDEETSQESPYVYLSRPLDVAKYHKFMRVLVAGLESHEAMMNALNAPSSGGGSAVASTDMGPVPAIDINQAQSIVDSLLADLGSMAIILASRDGQVLLERGAVGYVNREALTDAILPVVMTNINVKDIVGGQVNSLQFYDGDNYDIFVLSVGLHHFMCIMFEGQMGSRQFGFVNRFGRKAVEDLIALLGANAFFIRPPEVKQEEPKTESRRARKPKQQEDEPVVLEPAQFDLESDQADEPALELEPIPEDQFNVDALFGDGGDDGDFDSLFDPDTLEEIARENQQGQNRAIDWDEAVDLGLLNK